MFRRRFQQPGPPEEGGQKRAAAPDGGAQGSNDGGPQPASRRRLSVVSDTAATKAPEAVERTTSRRLVVKGAKAKVETKVEGEVKEEPSTVGQPQVKAEVKAEVKVSAAAPTADYSCPGNDNRLASREEPQEVSLAAAASGSASSSSAAPATATAPTVARATLPMTHGGACLFGVPMPEGGFGADEENVGSAGIQMAAAEQDLRHLRLVQDHPKRPLWVLPSGRIVFETFHTRSAEVADFLIAVAEPVSRPELLHEYQITVLSLHAAISTGVEVDVMIKLLTKLSKNVLDVGLVSFIQEQGRSVGKTKLVLRHQQYYLEAADPELLAKLKADPIIASCLIAPGHGDEEQSLDFRDHLTLGAAPRPLEVDARRVEEVKAAAHRLQMPLLQEYEFKLDRAAANPELPIFMRPAVDLRPYQQRALAKMFTVDGRCRSGIVVLPCGAGKTLTGIAATSRIKRRTLVLTTTAVAVDQWRAQFLQYSTIAPEDIYILTAEHKRPIEDHEQKACVVISTYSMLGFGGKRSGDTEVVLSQIQQLEWGLLIVDEVQVMPARTFRTVATTVKSHCSLGLTATLVREDDLIADLHWLIGPKLYEANWQQLQDEGFLACVRCAEVWCEMSRPFLMEYLYAVEDKDEALRRALWTCNPNKLKVCQYLIQVHENRGDKILVFSDNIFILEDFATRLGRYFICGKVDQRERMQILSAFKESPNCNTIFLSKVGDNAIDLPNASVIIQISSHYGSRRQEAQRLGRILRPKKKTVGSTSRFNAFFYSLVSRDTQEMYYASRRQQFLVEQGYSYHVLRDQDVDRMILDERLIYSPEEQQLELLKRVLETARRGEGEEAEEVQEAAVPQVAGAAATGDAAANKEKRRPKTEPTTTTAPAAAAPATGVVEERVALASLSGGLDGSYTVNSAAFNRKLLKPPDGMEL